MRKGRGFDERRRRGVRSRVRQGQPGPRRDRGGSPPRSPDGGESTGLGYGPGGEAYRMGRAGQPGMGRFEEKPVGWRGERDLAPRRPYGHELEEERGGDLADRDADRDRERGEQPGWVGSGPRGIGRWSTAGESHRGRGPRDHHRSDARIREDVCERLTEDHEVDASEISVAVASGEVTLEGTVDERRIKWLAEEIAIRCLGVVDVHNCLHVRRSGPGERDESAERPASFTRTPRDGHR